MFKLLSICTLITGLSLFSPALAADENFYRINVTVDSGQRILYGTTEVEVYNNSEVPWETLYFHLGMNNNYDTKMRVLEVTNEKEAVLPSSFYKYDYLGEMIEDKTVFQVSLDEALNPKESRKLKFRYEITNLTRMNQILFFDDSIFDNSNGSWYPRLINFRDGKWQKKDFVTNNYEVQISVGGEEVIASSGIEIENEAIKARQQKKVLYKVNQQRNFAFVVSNSLASENTSLPEKVQLKTYFKNNRANKWNEKIPVIVEEIYSHYQKKLGFWPYPQISIVPGNTFAKGGYANANLIVLHDSLEVLKTDKEIENYLRWHLAYLMAKQYLGFWVSEKGDYPKWVTSGGSLYLAYAFMKEKNYPINDFKSYLDTYTNASTAGFNTRISQPLDELKYGNFDWENIIEKGKSAQVFKMLETTVSRKVITDSLVLFLNKQKNQLVSDNIFETIVEQTSGKNLEWFFDQWVRSTKVVDYAITRIKQDKRGNKYKVTISLKRNGNIVMPVSIAVTLKSGSKAFHIWDGNQTSGELNLEYNEPARFAEVDPAGILPDINRANNKLGVTSY